MHFKLNPICGFENDISGGRWISAFRLSGETLFSISPLKITFNLKAILAFRVQLDFRLENHISGGRLNSAHSAFRVPPCFPKAVSKSIFALSLNSDLKVISAFRVESDFPT